MTIFAEIFIVSWKPHLHLYELNVAPHIRERQSLGNQLAAFFRQATPHEWCFADGVLVANVEATPNDLDGWLSDARKSKDEYAAISSITRTHADVTAMHIATFAKWHMEWRHQKDIEKLYPYASVGNNVFVRREITVKPWVVQAEPAVSVSVTSSPYMNETLLKTLTRAPNIDLSGCLLYDKTSGVSYRFVSLDGKLTEQTREELLARTKSDKTIKILREATPGEPVVWVERNYRSYRFVARQLQLGVENQHYTRLGINGGAVRAQVVMPPGTRDGLVAKASEYLRRRHLIGDQVSTSTHSQAFTTTNIPKSILLANGNSVYLSKSIMADLEKFGCFSVPQSSEVRAAYVIDPNEDPPGAYNFLIPALRKAKSLGINFVGSLRRYRDGDGNIFSGVVDDAVSDGHNFIFAILEGAKPKGVDERYVSFKRATINRGVMSQVLYSDTSNKPGASDNIVLSLIAKLGGIPYVLSEPLPYADVVVGMDISRQRKTNRPGTRNTPACVQIYQNNGQFIQYNITNEDIDGETIPTHMLESWFPKSHFAGKRVLIHRDGLFRGTERSDLYKWGSRIGAEFLLVEVRKNFQPRLYQKQNGKITNPPKGTYLIVDERTALVMSSPPPFGGSTQRPLQVVTDDRLSLADAVHSVLSLTLLHHGSLLQPTLPVTLHHSDKIARLLMEGIRPKEDVGTSQWWL